jgi:hypothetical protein
MSFRRLDIFRQLPDGTPVLVASAPNLEEAEKRVNEMAATNPGPYAVLDVSSANIVLTFQSTGGRTIKAMAQA